MKIGSAALAIDRFHERQFGPQPVVIAEKIGRPLVHPAGVGEGVGGFRALDEEALQLGLLGRGSLAIQVFADEFIQSGLRSHSLPGTRNLAVKDGEKGVLAALPYP
ncbi:MAG TPA: hypothetical protein VNK04_07445 [Gemmataceae bacterium]|nr:hypothetical protein [Gemmataceae bacterium]